MENTKLVSAMKSKWYRPFLNKIDCVQTLTCPSVLWLATAKTKQPCKFDHDIDYHLKDFATGSNICIVKPELNSKGQKQLIDILSCIHFCRTT